MNAGALLSTSARRYPDTVALWTDGVAVSYQELNQRVNALAHGLLQLGLQPGQAVALYANNAPEWIEAFFAASKIGAPVVQVSHRAHSRELEHVLADSQARVVLVDEATAPALAAALAARPLPVHHALCLGAELPDLGPECQAVPYARVLAGNCAEPDMEPLPTDIQALNYTSGTTGLPKGAVITHSNVVAGQHFLFALEYGLTRQDCILISAALCHRTGWGRVINAVGVGCTAVLMRRFDPADAMLLIQRHRVTVVGMVPTMLRMLFKLPDLSRYDTTSVRLFHLTGEASPMEVKEGIWAHFPNAGIYTFFALTEGGTVSVLPPAEQRLKPASVGRPMPSVWVRVVDDGGRDVAVGVEGEIWVKAGAPGYYTVMHSYWNNPAATADVFSGHWLKTGDVGRLDSDGYLYITDRKKDMIVSGGLNIYSKEVENVLMCHPAVGEAAVIGVPDPEWGEAVKAFILLRPGQQVGQDELLAYCRDNMAGYKRPKYVEFVTEFPRNAAGKVLKRLLRAGRGATGGTQSDSQREL